MIPGPAGFAIVVTETSRRPFLAGWKGARMSEVTQTAVVNLSDAASAKVRDLLTREGRDDLALRIAVEPGGCSGLRYALFFDDRTLDGDVRGQVGGVSVVTD